MNESTKNRSSSKSKSKSSNVVSGSNSSSEDEYINNNNNIRGSREVPNKRLAGSFGRLKAQRVKYLARATSSTKKDVKGREYEEKVIKDASFDTSIHSYHEPKRLAGQKKINVLRVKSNVSRANRLQEIQDTVQKDMTHEDMELSEKAYKDEVEQLSKRQTRPEKLLKSDARVSDSRASAASFGGWSRGESMQHDYHRPTDISKKGKKLNADSDFFSRKSFRDLGCTTI